MDVFYEIAKAFNLSITIKDLRNVPMEVCIERDKKRDVQSILDIKSLHDHYIKS